MGAAGSAFFAFFALHARQGGHRRALPSLQHVRHADTIVEMLQAQAGNSLGALPARLCRQRRLALDLLDGGRHGLDGAPGRFSLLNGANLGGQRCILHSVEQT